MYVPNASYDEDADVLYVRLADAEVAKSLNLDDLRIVDYSANGTVIGIEFISASEELDLSGVPSRPAVEHAIGDSGFKIPTVV